MRVTICSETVPYTANDGTVAYPEGMNECLKNFISVENEVTLVVIDKDADGSELTDELLSKTEVLVWWGHVFHKNISDEVTERVAQYVQRGMGLVALHSAHKSKILMRLLGTPCDLSWREIGEHERLWCIDPTHPIAEGLNEEFVLIPHEEMYGEPYGIPEPPEHLPEITDFNGAFCVVPALAFSKNGQRLGYGGGYYDRFLSDFDGVSAGLCYSDFFINKLPAEKHDIALDIIVSEKGVFFPNG